MVSDRSIIPFQHDLTLSSNDTTPTRTHPLSLHDALPISPRQRRADRHIAAQVQADIVQEQLAHPRRRLRIGNVEPIAEIDRKSTRLNSSHSQISYAVFCWKKKMISGGSIIPFRHGLTGAS